MYETWTIRTRIALSLGVLLGATLGIGILATRAIQSLLEAKAAVIEHAANVGDAVRVQAALVDEIAASRGYLLTASPPLRQELTEARAAYLAALAEMRTRPQSEEELDLLARIEQAEEAHQEVLQGLLARRAGSAELEAVAREFEADLVPRRRELDARIDAYVQLEETNFAARRVAADQAVDSARNLLIGLVAAATLLALGGGRTLTRSLSRDITAAVERVRASSVELQAAATRQASAAREQATAMTELATTSAELSASSRLIAESAQAVARIAGTTSESARGGGDTVRATEASVAAIREQVDAITLYILELGRKSQQIGAILELINELAEQTNILAINATIEAAGAGEGGRRFGVVADEIRKLADRVGASTKVIRGLIDDVRSSVNTTAMAMESASKVVDAGAREVGELTVAFQKIADLVKSSAASALEIELSTRQQAVAVGQVDVAIAQVVQSTRDLEATSTQTLRTASELSTLSEALTGLVLSSRPPAG